MYSVKIQLCKHIPQLLPLKRCRIKIYYRSIWKLCTNCFEKHPNKERKNTKVRWIHYVKIIMDISEDFPRHLYGRWAELVNRKASHHHQGTDEHHHDENSSTEAITLPSAPIEQAANVVETTKPNDISQGMFETMFNRIV